MVTSTKQPEKKVVKMAENSGTVVPQRTLLGEVNEQITCPLCHGYYIDATTIVECLHSFCRSCIIKHLQVKSYCPVCEMMINSAKPNIKLDKALQDIVYKLVPGLFQKEMERRQHFYSSRPGPAASATPEQRGEDTERIIFSPEDVISFSLEYADITDTDSISSKSSDSNETQSTSGARRYLQCPAIVNISHLKKFLSMKFDVDSTQFAIDILYKRVPLPDCYTLMDIAYIYNWKRNEPMRFFYQIIDYVAIRSRLFDTNGKRSHFQDRKSSPTLAEDSVVNSPALNMNDQGSEASSGTDSPMPDDNNVRKTTDSKTSNLNLNNLSKESQSIDVKDKSNNTNDSNTDNAISLPSNNDEDVEKSQFLISFELTAKNNNQPKSLPAPSTSTVDENNQQVVDGSKSHTNVDEKNLKVVDGCKIHTNVHLKTDDSLKRKNMLPMNVPEMKKVKIELEKTKLPPNTNTLPSSSVARSLKTEDGSTKTKECETANKTTIPPAIKSTPLSAPLLNKDTKQQTLVTAKQQVPDIPAIKRPICVPQNTASPKRKTHQDLSSMQTSLSSQKTVSPLKIQLPKVDSQCISMKTDAHKPAVKKMPDLKPSGTTPLTLQKTPPVNKVRMDLLANNSDPTIDRSKILSQVNSSLNAANMAQTSGDPLKSLFDSCKINIPSSLSITLTDQKQDQRNINEPISNEQNKNVTNKNLASASNSAAHKAPSPPVHNYIEILKLPDTDPKKQQKTDSGTDSKTNTPSKTDSNVPQTKLPSKPSETSAKGPVPNLKPISESKLAKQSATYGSPITFQQTFEQQLQSLQSDKKSKVPRNKGQVPKLVPATPKTLSAANKSSNPAPPKLPIPSTTTAENKTSTALDLSTPHNVQSQLDPQQNKTFETMQSIANLAKKQNLPLKVLPPAMSQNNTYSGISNRPTPLRIPTNVSQMKYDKGSPSISQTTSVRQEIPSKSNQIKQLTPSPNPTVPSLSYHNTSAAQPSRSQTRSPSSSPKLVIAEDKQSSGPSTDQSINQINQISSTQIPHINVPKSESHKVLPGPSKPGLKPVKPLTPSGKITGVRQPINATVKSNSNSGINNSADFLPQQQFLAQHALLRQQMEMQWFKATHYDLFKNMTNMAHQAQSDLNNKDKQ